MTEIFEEKNDWIWFLNSFGEKVNKHKLIHNYWTGFKWMSL